MNDYIDMHIHTTYSDGTLTPSEILERSLEIGLKAISITDHNTIDGVTEAMKYANNAIEIIPGIEMTATYPKPLHILGYYIDIHSASFNAGIKTLRMQKYKWLLMLVRNLKKIGIDIDLDEIKHKYGRIKLEYIALELVNQGIAENIRDIYLLYFNNRNFMKETPSSPEEIISLIKPGVKYKEINDKATELIAEECIKLGLIEDKKDVRKYYYHSIGHSLGMDTHDIETPHRDITFVPGVVFTVEPGIYIEEECIGIRIEDDILVTEDGNINLSKDIIKSVEDIEKFMNKEF